MIVRLTYFWFIYHQYNFIKKKETDSNFKISLPNMLKPSIYTVIGSG